MSSLLLSDMPLQGMRVYDKYVAYLDRQSADYVCDCNQHRLTAEIGPGCRRHRDVSVQCACCRQDPDCISGTAVEAHHHTARAADARLLTLRHGGTIGTYSGKLG